MIRSRPPDLSVTFFAAPALVRLRGQQGAESTILRADIEEVRPNRESLMPEGFEQALTPLDLAHLLEFLQHPLPLPAHQ